MHYHHGRIRLLPQYTRLGSGLACRRAHARTSRIPGARLTGKTTAAARRFRPRSGLTSQERTNLRAAQTLEGLEGTVFLRRKGLGCPRCGGR